MSDELFLDLADKLSETLLQVGSISMQQRALDPEEYGAIRQVLKQGFVAFLSELSAQYSGFDCRSDELSAAYSAFTALLENSDVAGSMLSSVMSGSQLDTAYLSKQYAVITANRESPSLDIEQCFTAFSRTAVSIWRNISHGDSTRTTYTVFIGRNLGSLAIGDHAQATTSDAFDSRVGEDLAANEVRYRELVVERYNRLGFGGLGQIDLRLSDVALDDVFVRLSLTVEKVVREQVSPEESEPDQRRHGWWERGERRDRETTRATKESEQPRERIVVIQEPITLTNALAQNALIVGEPGAGKSTLLRWLAVTFAAGLQQESDRLGASADADRLPLLVELGRLPERYLQAEGRETPNWETFLPEHITAQASFHGIPPALLAMELAEGRCLLLCDGLDEIADLAARRRMADSLAEYARGSANRLVLSSRPAGVSGSEGALGGRFQRISIQRFAPDDVQRFFRFWYALDEDLEPDEQMRQADALFDRVKTAPKTLELAGTPLLATLLLLIWRNEGDLPERRAELYEQCCRMLIEHWEAHHDVAYTGVLRDLGWKRHLRLLAPLAYTIQSTGQRTDAPLAELAPVLARALQAEGLAGVNANLEAEKFLRALSLRSGLLQFLGGDRYGFPHLTFQEYLAARHIAAQPDPDYIDLVMMHLHEAWWREVHLLVIGHLGSENDGASRTAGLLLNILSLYRAPWWFLCPQHVLRWQLPTLIEREIAVRVSWQYDRRVAWVLTRELIFVSGSLEEWPSQALDFVVRSSIERCAESVIHQTLSDPGRIVQDDITPVEIAVRTLAKLGKISPKVVGEMVRALASPYSDMKILAVRSLGLMGDTSSEVISVLIQALTSPDELVRQAVLHSLVHLGQTSQDVVTALVRALGSSNSRVKSAAASVLEQLGWASPMVISALISVRVDPYSAVRKIAIDREGHIGRAPEALVALIRALRDANSDVKATEIIRLTQSDKVSLEMTEWLIGALRDSDSAVRAVAASELGQLGQPSARTVTELVRGLCDPDSAVKAASATALAKLGQSSPEIIAALVFALEDDERDVREAAASSIRRLGQTSPEVVPALIRALSDYRRHVREAAAISLGHLGDALQEVVPALVVASEDFRCYVREGAIRGLSQQRKAMPEVMSALMKALDDSDSDVRAAAVDG